MFSIPNISESTLRLGLYVCLILCSHVACSVYSQKIYKRPYRSTQQQGEQYFTHVLGIPLMHSLFGMVYGLVRHHLEGEDRKDVQVGKSLGLGVVEVVIILLTNWVIVISSFTTYNLIHCCSFLSVVLFALLFSRVKDQSMHIGTSKIIISLLVCLGIFVYNYFSTHHKHEAMNQPLTPFTVTIIVVLLLLEGYRPDLQAQIKTQANISSTHMYLNVSTIVFASFLLTSACTYELWDMLVFMASHHDITADLLVHSCLGVFGDVFIYQLLLLHRQHVVPLIVTVRRVVTSVVNLLWFKHEVTGGQCVGLAMVGLGVGVELMGSYMQREGRKKGYKVKDIDDYDNTQFI